jgi:signal transduction histidine kinase
MVKRQIKITWPAEKKYPVFINDEAIVGDICEVLMSNALESLPQKGSLVVEGSFSEKSTTLKFIDEGAGIKEEDREKIFLPFFTTKSGHHGLGLTRAKKLVKVLDGILEYEPREKGSMFKLTIPGREEKKKNK